MFLKLPSCYQNWETSMRKWCGRRKLHFCSAFGKKKKAHHQKSTNNPGYWSAGQPESSCFGILACFKEYFLHLVQEVLNRNLGVLEWWISSVIVANIYLITLKIGRLEKVNPLLYVIYGLMHELLT